MIWVRETGWLYWNDSNRESLFSFVCRDPVSPHCFGHRWSFQPSDYASKSITWKFANIQPDSPGFQCPRAHLCRCQSCCVIRDDINNQFNKCHYHTAQMLEIVQTIVSRYIAMWANIWTILARQSVSGRSPISDIIKAIQAIITLICSLYRCQMVEERKSWKLFVSLQPPQDS